MRLRSFDTYADYVDRQRRTTQAKKAKVWVLESELAIIAADIRQQAPYATFGICHGVRTGAEVDYLSKALGCMVLGTDLEPSEHDSVIQWDFHEVKPDWLGAADFIYSNSLDHSYDPEMAVARWLSCLSPSGRCYIHWSPSHDRPKFGIFGGDCFQASREGYAALLGEVGTVDRVIPTWGERVVFVVGRNGVTL
jgi:hypothetical protein